MALNIKAYPSDVYYPLDVWCKADKGSRVISSFADRGTEKFWTDGRAGHLPTDIRKRTMAKLQLIDAAVELEFLKLPPGNKLEALKGDRKGQHSIRINDQWRICFRWTGSDAEDVEIVDYHD